MSGGTVPTRLPPPRRRFSEEGFVATVHRGADHGSRDGAAGEAVEDIAAGDGRTDAAEGPAQGGAGADRAPESAAIGPGEGRPHGPRHRAEERSVQDALGRAEAQGEVGHAGGGAPDRGDGNAHENGRKLAHDRAEEPAEEPGDAAEEVPAGVEVVDGVVEGV